MKKLILCSFFMCTTIHPYADPNILYVIIAGLFTGGSALVHATFLCDPNHTAISHLVPPQPPIQFQLPPAPMVETVTTQPHADDQENQE